jgi:ATP-dependent DNA helicase PIF1
MTINKSQGQTFQKVGVFLPKSVFSHGQLYVAFSHVGHWEDLKVLVQGGFKPATQDAKLGQIPEGVYTANIVYRDVFH